MIIEAKLNQEEEATFQTLSKRVHVDHTFSALNAHYSGFENGPFCLPTIPRVSGVVTVR